MERTQQDWFSIFDHQRLLYRVEQFWQQLPATECSDQQKKVMATQ